MASRSSSSTRASSRFRRISHDDFGMDVEAKGHGTAERILRNKAKRRGGAAFVVGLLMAIGSGFAAWATHENQRALRLLKSAESPVEAEIIRRFVAPNGITKRVEYKLANSRGLTATRNVEVEPSVLEPLGGASSIAVIWVPDEPSVSRLALRRSHGSRIHKYPCRADTAWPHSVTRCRFSCWWRAHSCETVGISGTMPSQKSGD